MKNLITFLICLLSVTVFAANPTYNSFVPGDFTNNGNTIGLNPASPKFAGTNGVNTNANYIWNGVNQFTNTGNNFVGNLTLYNLTNELGQPMGYLRSIITTNAAINTNQFNFSGAGATNYNRSYDWNDTIHAWTNIAGFTVGLVAGNGDHEAMPAPFDGSGGATACYIDGGATIAAMQVVWDQGSSCGTNPTPTGFFTTNYTYITNTFYILTNVVVAVSKTNMIYLDVVNGNDLTAVPGLNSLPYKTIVTAASKLQPGGSLFMYPGVATNVAGVVKFPPNVTISGFGSGVSRITNSWLFGSTKIANVTMGVLEMVATNSEYQFNDMMIDGLADCMYWAFGTNSTLNAYNCIFKTTWDAWADTVGQVSVSATNNVAKFYNCQFINPYYTTGSVPDIIIFGPSKFYMYGGEIISLTQTPGQNSLIMTDPAWLGATNGYAEFHHVYFDNENKAGSNWIIFNPMGMTMKLYDCTANTNLIYDPFNKVEIIDNKLLAP